MMNYSNYLYIAIRAAIDAGKAIMDIYTDPASDFDPPHPVAIPATIAVTAIIAINFFNFIFFVSFDLDILQYVLYSYVSYRSIVKSKIAGL